MWFRSLIVLSALASPSLGQSFNFELGPGAPPASYGAAAQQPGTWNVVTVPVPSSLFEAVLPAAVDVNGAVTGVSARFHSTAWIFWAETYLYSFPTGAQHAALLTDGLDGDWTYGYVDFEINGLEPGLYEVWTYGAPQCTAEVVGAYEGTQQLSWLQPWAGYPVPGQHYLIHHVWTTGTIHTDFHQPGRGVTGVQLRKLDGARGTTCAGDGSASACPCGNFGASGHGCATSFSPNGARLDALGTASVAADSLVLSASGVSNSFVTFIQGSSPLRAGEGMTFGDGLLCAGGSLIRLGLKLASGNTSSIPQTGDAPLSVLGALPNFGGTYVYQAWYRDADLGFCAAGTFNLSNGVYVAWGI